MTKKFTEEQYQKILNIGNRDRGIGIGWIIGNSLFTYVNSIDRSADLYVASLFLIPESREWAHEQFVEKEKKYVWKLNGLYLVRDNFDGSIIFDSYKNGLTESEIREWGYNPDMFDKELVYND